MPVPDPVGRAGVFFTAYANEKGAQASRERRASFFRRRAGRAGSASLEVRPAPVYV